ncbi:putative drug exporter of the RND superfamily [Blastococcus aurantiacus]|uniref:Putative drug exporter of the RND superfamily n=1 Tax=Blastococcus aurantiacus TaxID=1550231 RepID=A0A1G7HLF0_9ACTN|nr:MMPL family transporter [Blastococcus aurantiacus]SDF01146.1 putative drug exporter of the RND superfamily [Blastococcus aurantiacus]
MSRFLHRLGRSTAAHPWRALAAWVLIAVVAVTTAGAFGGTPQDNFDVEGAPALAGIESLRENFPGSGAAGSSAQVVVHDPDGGEVGDAQLSDLIAGLADVEHVTSIAPPRWSDDRDTALLHVVFDVPVTHPDLASGLGVEALQDAVSTADDGLQVELGGELPNTSAEAVQGTGEIAGVLLALVLMVFVLGTVVAAGLPLLVALAGLGISVAGVTLLAAVTDVSTTAPTVAMMVGLGVGIDYALLLITRHLEYVRAGVPIPEAAGRATATAGRSVVFAAAIVLVSLMGLPLAGLPTYSSFGFATGIAVVSVAAATLTLVPAFCGLLGRRLLPRRERRGLPPRRSRPVREPLSARWAAAVTRRPVPWALAALLLMATLALPALDMRTFPRDVSNNANDSTTRQAFDIVTAEFGAGANGPITVVVDRAAVGDAGVAAAAARLSDVHDVVAVTGPVVSPDGQVAVLTAEPAFGPADERTPELLERLRAQVDGAEITGNTAMLSDISVMLSERMWLVVGFVVAVSMLLLAAMFRSAVVPLKAAALNLLSIGAAYGVVTAVFQWGWATDLVGLDHAMPVSSWLPILMFAILFGLSMDYEVFLLSRIREHWLRSGDARASVVRGVAGTGRVISTAAAVMVVVFLGFATESDLVVRQLGLGMAVAVLLDATVVRMILVPATMTLLGRGSWWLPAWLDRLLPTIEAEVTDEIRGDGPGSRASAAGRRRDEELEGVVG